jgi:hypothetical protein
MRETFVGYLTEATRAALRRAASGEDDGTLWRMNKLCRRGVTHNWNALNERKFLKEFLWVVGAIQKAIEQHDRFYPDQVRLFRGCAPHDVLRNRGRILDQWQNKRCNLNRRMVDDALPMMGEANVWFM